MVCHVARVLLDSNVGPIEASVQNFTSLVGVSGGTCGHPVLHETVLCGDVGLDLFVSPDVYVLYGILLQELEVRSHGINTAVGEGRGLEALGP